LLLALVYFGFDKFVLAPRREATQPGTLSGRGMKRASAIVEGLFRETLEKPALKALLSAGLVLALAACATVPESAKAGKSLRDELLTMEAEDQALRGASPVDVKAAMESDAVHTRRVKAILAERGWPPVSEVGKDGSSAIWLLVQHADADPEFQRKALSLMEPLVATGEASTRQFAYLWDRTHTPQKYGTQGKCYGKNDWRPHPIEVPERVDAERAAKRLPPLAQYIAEVSELCTDAP
jgi:hypothetical protein